MHTGAEDGRYAQAATTWAGLLPGCMRECHRRSPRARPAVDPPAGCPVPPAPQIGNTPMIGKNDVKTEVFYPADATKVGEGGVSHSACWLWGAAAGARRRVPARLLCPAPPPAPPTPHSSSHQPATLQDRPPALPPPTGSAVGARHAVGAMDRVLEPGPRPLQRGELRVLLLFLHPPAAPRLHPNLQGTR